MPTTEQKAQSLAELFLQTDETFVQSVSSASDENARTSLQSIRKDFIDVCWKIREAAGHVEAVFRDLGDTILPLLSDDTLSPDEREDVVREGVRPLIQMNLPAKFNRADLENLLNTANSVDPKITAQLFLVQSELDGFINDLMEAVDGLKALDRPTPAEEDIIRHTVKGLVTLQTTVGQQH